MKFLFLMRINVKLLKKLVGDKSLDLIRESRILSSQFNGRPLNTETALKSFVRVLISYDTLSYELTTESAKMEIVDLLANIGGNLGLFMGVSVLSLCELVVVFVEFCYLFKTNFRFKINNKL
jgi:hypothetical protein